MERLQRYLINLGQAERTTYVQVECRGRVEDAKLELEFRRICDGKNIIGKMPNLDIRFMDKKHNSTGLQLADLVAQPIGRHVVKPDQPNCGGLVVLVEQDGLDPTSTLSRLAGCGGLCNLLF
jgi:hypothetical protein